MSLNLYYSSKLHYFFVSISYEWLKAFIFVLSTCAMNYYGWKRRKKYNAQLCRFSRSILF